MAKHEVFQEDLFPPGVEDASLWWELTSGSGADTSLQASQEEASLLTMSHGELQVMRAKAFETGDIDTINTMLSKAREYESLSEFDARWVQVIEDCTRDIKTLAEMTSEEV